MKYFIDTEFIEGFWDAVFFKKRHFIDLISIGIVCEDGRTYHAISKEYNYNDADDWVKKNVLIPLYTSTVHGDARNLCNAKNFHSIYGKSNKQIAEDIYQFVCPYEKASEYADVGSIDDGGEFYLKANPPQFYGYYADYDWVLFCSLFGRMIDLPKGFPMYCIDLKQMLDEGYIHQVEKHLNETRLESWLKSVKNNPNYPKQTNEHNALGDARWNLELYKFINSGFKGEEKLQTPQATKSR